MPIHDWTRVHSSLFHNFHLGWVAEICRRLNQGVLPPTHFAMSETLELRPPSPFSVLPEPELENRRSHFRERRFHLDEPPPARFTVRREEIEYANRNVTIREADTHAAVAAILLVTRQEKQIAYRWEEFVRCAVGALSHGIHLLIIDLFPPSPRDPQGIHQAIWQRIHDEPFELPPDKTLTLASYAADREIVAYVEPVAVGGRLPDRPVFLTPHQYVLCPLEATYEATWNVLPAALKGPLELPGNA